MQAQSEALGHSELVELIFLIQFKSIDIPGKTPLKMYDAIFIFFWAKAGCTISWGL